MIPCEIDDLAVSSRQEGGEREPLLALLYDGIFSIAKESGRERERERRKERKNLPLLLLCAHTRVRESKGERCVGSRWIGNHSSATAIDNKHKLKTMTETRRSSSLNLSKLKPFKRGNQYKRREGNDPN